MIDEVLKERGSRYGAFKHHAQISQQLQTVLWDCPSWDELPLDSRQALVVICDKIARMLNGDPDYDDNWVDIIGYATLVLNRIRDEERERREAIKRSIQENVVVSTSDTYIYNDLPLFEHDGPDYSKADE